MPEMPWVGVQYDCSGIRTKEQLQAGVKAFRDACYRTMNEEPYSLRKLFPRECQLLSEALAGENPTQPQQEKQSAPAQQEGHKV